MRYEISIDNHKPLYEQIREQIRMDISFYCIVISELEVILGAEGYELVYSTADRNTSIEETIKRVNAQTIIMVGISDREVASRVSQFGIPVGCINTIFKCNVDDWNRCCFSDLLFS